jgi:hypothetical protein
MYQKAIGGYMLDKLQTRSISAVERLDEIVRLSGELIDSASNDDESVQDLWVIWQTAKQIIAAKQLK